MLNLRVADMNIHVDVAGYIVLVAALFFAVVLAMTVCFGMKHGSRSKIGNAWAANAGVATQILGVALACSSTTMPLPPLLIYLACGVGLFFIGRYVKREAHTGKVRR